MVLLSEVLRLNSTLQEGNILSRRKQMMQGFQSLTEKSGFVVIKIGSTS
jgi:hypothetical protein